MPERPVPPHDHTRFSRGGKLSSAAITGLTTGTGGTSGGGGGSSSGTSDHGSLTGLGDNDHPQYERLAWFNVEDYGAVHDGATDDRDAIQDAIDAAETAGGGVVYFPAGVYVVAGALQDGSRSNAQILLPLRDYVDTEQLTIHLLGAHPPPPIFSVIGTTPVPDGHSVIKGTLNTGSGTEPALIGAHGPAGTFGDFSNVHVKIENLTFRMPSNPVLSAVNLSRVASCEIDNVIVDVGSYQVTAFTEPTTATSFGIRLPGNNNGAFSNLGTVNVGGFYKGYEVGEHTEGYQVTAWGCKQAATFPFANHASHFDRFMSVDCERGLVFTDDHYFNIDQLNIEHAASGWNQTDYDIDDASNKGHGHLAWHVVLEGVGVDHTFTVNGATDIHKVEIGDSPYGTPSFATPAIVLGTAAAAGAASTVIRSDSTIVAFDTTVPTTAASADAAATGSAAVAARRDHRHGMPTLTPGIGEILISDTPSTPLIFADLLQNEAQTDLLYADP